MPAINTDGVTGPSGGLMLALAFTDTLNRGDLTGGRKIAGTGTIDWSGVVGDIGYVTYKVQGAAAAGATVFFVPWGNLAEARRAAPPRMQVVPVASFEEALGWLCRSGPDDGACPRLAARPAGLTHPAQTETAASSRSTKSCAPASRLLRRMAIPPRTVAPRSSMIRVSLASVLPGLRA